MRSVIRVRGYFVKCILNGNCTTSFLLFFCFYHLPFSISVFTFYYLLTLTRSTTRWVSLSLCTFCLILLICLPLFLFSQNCAWAVFIYPLPPLKVRNITNFLCEPPPCTSRSKEPLCNLPKCPCVHLCDPAKPVL